MIAAIIALSLVVLVGLVGQISLAQAAFAGAAGFALSKIGTGLPFPLSLLVGRARGRRARHRWSPCPRCASAACSSRW